MTNTLRSNKAAIFWTLIRIIVGWTWLVSGWNKIGNFDATGFIEEAIKTVKVPNAAILDGYSSFLELIVLPNIGIFNFLIAWGEFLIGIGLIIGMFTTSSLFIGAFLNFNFMLAGATYINPILYTIQIILLIVRPATYRYGIDYYFMPKFKEVFIKNKG